MTDTTREAVERLAGDLIWREPFSAEEVAATLRALLDERDALGKRAEQAEREIAAAVKARAEAIRLMAEASREAGFLRGKCDGLEIERDAARAEGFAAGIEAAARISCDCWTLNPATHGYQIAQAIRALKEDTND